MTVDHNWKKVNFGRQFLNPVVVAGGMSANGSPNGRRPDPQRHRQRV